MNSPDENTSTYVEKRALLLLLVAVTIALGGIPPRHNSCRLHRTKNPGGGEEGKKLARYGQTFKNRAVARLLPPESAAVELVAMEAGIGVGIQQLAIWLRPVT